MPGYKDPPKETQFKKGVSGNPKGRPKGSRNFLSLLENIIEQKIPIKQGSEEVKITKKEAMLIQWINKAIKGDMSAIQHLIPLLFQIEQKNEDKNEKQNVSLKDKEILDNFISKFYKGEKND